MISFSLLLLAYYLAKLFLTGMHFLGFSLADQFFHVCEKFIWVSQRYFLLVSGFFYMRYALPDEMDVNICSAQYPSDIWSWVSISVYHNFRFVLCCKLYGMLEFIPVICIINFFFSVNMQLKMFTTVAL